MPFHNAKDTVRKQETRGETENTTAAAGIALNGSSIMLVEDETVVALAVNDSLIDLGFSVVGPFSRVSDACRALQVNQVDAAILDVNLDGEMVYALAKMLHDSENTVCIRDRLWRGEHRSRV